MRDAGRLDRADLLKLDLGAPAVVKEASAVPEQYRNDVELELVQEPRRQVLLNDLGAAPEPDVLTVRGLLRPSSARSIPSVTKWNVVPPPSRPARAGDG